MINRTRTPCIGICSTTYGDEVCRGCKRFSTEVINWNSFSPDEREAVWQRLEKLKIQIMSSRVNIFDEELMQKSVDVYQIKVKEDISPLSKAFEIIKQISQSFDDLKEFGIDLKKENISLESLKNEIETELYTLSKAHYDRYFVEPLNKEIS